MPAPLTLNYATSSEVPLLDVYDGGVRLVFPVRPPPRFQPGASGLLIGAISNTFLVLASIYTQHTTNIINSSSLNFSGWKPATNPLSSHLWLFACFAAYFWVCIFWHFRSRRRSKDIVQTWEATPEELVVRMQNKHISRINRYPVAKVRDVQLKRSFKPFRGPAAVGLIIRLHKRLPVVGIIPGDSAHIATEAAAVFRKTLGLRPANEVESSSSPG